MNKPGFFAVIPASVRYDEDLTANAKLLYGEITALCNQTGQCWASNEYFSELYGVSKETISRWISGLKRNGHIDVKIDKKQGNNRSIYLLTKTSNPIDKIVKPLLTKSSNPIDKIVNSYNDNNTKNNTREYSARAIDYLKENCEARLEQEFFIPYSLKIHDLKKFLLDFDDQVDIEQLDYQENILLSRLTKYARNWIINQSKYEKKDNTGARPNYLKDGEE